MIKHTKRWEISSKIDHEYIIYERLCKAMRKRQEPRSHNYAGRNQRP